MSAGRAGTGGRFTLLSLEENEYYFEDVGCTAGYPAASEPSTSAASASGQQVPQRNTFKGRLHICSNSLYFEPEDQKQPIVKIPFASVRTIQEQPVRRVVVNFGSETQPEDDWGNVLSSPGTAGSTRNRRVGSVCGEEAILIETTTAMTLIPNQPHRAVRMALPSIPPFTVPEEIQKLPYYGVDFVFIPTYVQVSTVLPLIHCLHSIRLLALNKPGAAVASAEAMKSLFSQFNAVPQTASLTQEEARYDGAALAEARLQELIALRSSLRTFDLTEVADYSETPINVRSWIICANCGRAPRDGCHCGPAAGTQQSPVPQQPANPIFSPGATAGAPTGGAFHRTPSVTPYPITTPSTAGSQQQGAAASYALPVHLVTPLVSSPGLLLLTDKTLYFQSAHADIEAEPMKKVPLALVSHILCRRHATRDVGIELFVDTTASAAQRYAEPNPSGELKKPSSLNPSRHSSISSTASVSSTLLSPTGEDHQEDSVPSLTRASSSMKTNSAEVRALLRARHSFFFVFSNTATRNAFLQAVKAQPAYKPRPQLELPAVLRGWISGEVSNYLYLLYLNVIAGRSFKDLAQYPVFPWVLSDYESETIDLDDPKVYRDLSKPIGALNPDRLAQLKKRMDSLAIAYAEAQNERAQQARPQTELEKFESKRLLPFLYGTHYSTPGYVVHFLLRAYPAYMLRLQGGKFDHPDRLFVSVAATWASCLTNNADVKELIPEFYTVEEDVEDTESEGAANPDAFDRITSTPLGYENSSYGFDVFGSSSVSPSKTRGEDGKSSLGMKVIGLSGAAGNLAAVKPAGRFLVNSLRLPLGATQSGVEVDDVALPPWAREGGPAALVNTMRAALEHPNCSKQLHQWIDLIFGYKQTGAAAVAADNLFYPLTYPHNVNLDAITDPVIRHGLETQVLEFGQMPTQLFNVPHPPRNATEEEIEAFLKECSIFTKTMTHGNSLQPVEGLEFLVPEEASDNAALLARNTQDQASPDPVSNSGNPVGSTSAIEQATTRCDSSNENKTNVLSELSPTALDADQELTIDDVVSTFAGAALNQSAMPTTASSVLSNLVLSTGNDEEEAAVFRSIVRTGGTRRDGDKEPSSAKVLEGDSAQLTLESRALSCLPRDRSPARTRSTEEDTQSRIQHCITRHSKELSRWPFWMGMTTSPVAVVPPHRNGLACSHLSLNGDVLYTLTRDGIIKVYSEMFLESGPHQLRQTAVSSCPLTSIATVDAAGHFALIGSADNNLYLYSRLSGSVLGVAENAHDSSVSSVSIVSDALAVTGGLDSVVRVWHLSPQGIDRAEAVFSEHTASVRAVDVDRLERPQLVASGADDGRVLLWDLNSFQSLALPIAGTIPSSSTSFTVSANYPSPETITALRMHRDYLIIGTAGGTVQTWSLSMPTKPVHQFTVSGPVTSLVTSPSQNVLTSLGLVPASDVSAETPYVLDGVLVGTGSGSLSFHGCPYSADSAELWSRQFTRPIASLSMSLTSGFADGGDDSNGFANRTRGNKLSICFEDPAGSGGDEAQSVIFGVATTPSVASWAGGPQNE